MINKLQKKFILMTMFFVGIVIFGILAFLCIQSYERNEILIDRSLAWSLQLKQQEYEGSMLPSYTLIYNDRTDSFVLLGDERYVQFDVDALKRKINALPYDMKKEENGIIMKKHALEQGYICGIVDASVLKEQFSQLLSRCIGVFLISMGIFFSAVYFISRWIIVPVRRTWDAQKRFIADASHELKTPLTIILADSELLLEKDPDDPWLISLHEEAERMKKLIYDLLELARFDALPVHQSELVDLSQLCEKIALGMEEQAYDKKVMIDEHIEEDVFIHADPEDMHRLAALLLDNAVKYTPPGKTVSIRLTKKDHRFILRFSNPGTLSREQLAHIFERFYKADESRKNDGSFGLGLAIASETARRNKFELNADCRDGEVIFTVTGKTNNIVK